MKHLKTFKKINNDDIFDEIYNDDLDKVKELINSGINLETKNNLNWTPLFYSILLNRTEISEELIKSGANVNFKRKENSCLIAAADNNNLYIVKCLIDAGAEWNNKDFQNKDFLDYLNDYNKKEIINDYPEKYEEYLIKKEAEEKYNL